MINPKIQGMAEKAFKEAFGDDFDIKDRKHHRLMLAYAAMLEMGAEYIRLKAFERMFYHIAETQKDSEEANIGDSIEKAISETEKTVKGESDGSL